MLASGGRQPPDPYESSAHQGADAPRSPAQLSMPVYLALAGDSASYQAICMREIDRSSQSPDHRAAYLVARAGSLAPDSGVDPARLVQLAQEAVTGSPKLQWYTHALGLAHYRAGQFGLAVEYFRRSIEQKPEWYANPLNWLGLAMAHRSLGKTDEAQQWLDKALRWNDESLATAEGANIRDWDPHDRLAWQLLRREAQR